MKKWKKMLVSLLTVSVVTAVSAMSVMAADNYTYKVTVYSGNKGTIEGQDKVVFTGLDAGSQVILNTESVQVTDDKYYVKGFRLSGHDNEEALASPTIEVDGDADYVVAYGIKANMVAYTVNYQDADGKALANSQTFYGNVGDKPVVAYQYIENYIPQALALTKTLSDNEVENVFTFTYTPGEMDKVVETTTTVTTNVPAAGTVVSRGTAGNTGNTAGNVSGNVSGTATGTADAGTASENDTNTTGENTSEENETVESTDGRTPKEIIDLDDEETPKANIDAEDKNKKVSPIADVVIIIASLTALAMLIIYLRKRAK